MSFLEMTGITKRYPNDVLANDGVDLRVERNEIHAVVGENGAGKTTLMKILHGLEQPDGGSIRLQGEPVTLRSPLEANALGIGMVHQHFRLVPDFTVTQNVVLGDEPRRAGIFVDTAEAARRIAALIEAHGFSLDPRAAVSQLTVGQMQQVEIVKMLYRDARLLILDEPTSVLTEQEIRRLFDTMRSLKREGRTLIVITHKLHEVKEISERVTVMRKGRVVAVRDTAEVDERELARLMVGRDVLMPIRREARQCGEPVLELREVTLRRRGSDRPLLDRVNLAVRSCEIVGVAGVGGNGLKELEDVVAGLARISSGRVLHGGEDVSALSSVGLRRRGLAYVPADRLARGSCLESSVQENLIVTGHHRFLRAGFLDRRRIRQYAEELARSFSIDGSTQSAVGTLSGGNIQKVILARELSPDARLVIFSEPTWGLDVAASQFVCEKILAMRAAGAGILLISSNLDEVLGLADTVVVMYRGRPVAARPNDRALSKELIGEYMLGLRDDFVPAAAAGGRA
jgi:ABC-type uncharacterized transport system ATPase subunit